MLLYTALVQLNYRWATHWSQKNLLLLCTSSIYRYTLFLHPFSRSLFYPISICDSPPFDTPSFHSTLLLYAPYPTSSLSSHSTYNSLTHPTLRLPLLSTLPLFTPSLHSFTIHTPLISLHFYSSTSLHYTPFLPHLHPLSTFTLHMAHPPLTLPLLLFPTSYTLSILPIYPPLYRPTLQPLSTISSPTGYKSTPPYD